MLIDSRGGFETYQYVKDRIDEMIGGMKSATLFNLMVYVRGDVRMFRNQLVPATPENREAAREWFAPVNKNDNVAGKLKSLSGQYSQQIQYEASPLKPGNVNGFMKAAQAAMEQKADNIFVLCCDWERSTTHVSYLGGMTKEEYYASKGWDEARFAEYRKKADEYIRQAEEHLAKENAARAKAGKGKKFFRGKPLLYAYKVLKLPRLGDPPRTGGLKDFGPEDFIEHLKAVYKYNYVPEKLDEPKIHIVKLIAEDAAEDAGRVAKIANAFDGEFEYLHGAETMHNLVDFNPSAPLPTE